MITKSKTSATLCTRMFPYIYTSVLLLLRIKVLLCERNNNYNKTLQTTNHSTKQTIFYVNIFAVIHFRMKIK